MYLFLKCFTLSLASYSDTKLDLIRLFWDIGVLINKKNPNDFRTYQISII